MNQKVDYPARWVRAVPQYQTFHKQGLNCLYIDGHAKWVKAGQVDDYLTRNMYETNPYYYWFPVAVANANP